MQMGSLCATKRERRVVRIVKQNSDCVQVSVVQCICQVVHVHATTVWEMQMQMQMQQGLTRFSKYYFIEVFFHLYNYLFSYMSVSFRDGEQLLH